MNMKFNLILCLLLLLTGNAYTKDNDFEYALALEKKGFDWLAVCEFSRLRDSMTSEQQILLHRRLGRLHEKMGDTAARDNEYNQLLEKARNATTPLIKKAVRQITVQRAADDEIRARSLIGALEKALGEEKPDQAQIADLKRKLEPAVVRLEKYHSARVAAYQRFKGRSAAHDRELNQRSSALARAQYYAAFLLKGGDDVKHREMLQGLYDKKFKPLALQDIKAEDVLMPFYSGKILQDLNQRRAAAKAFLEAVEYPRIQANQATRKQAYYLASVNLYSNQNYRECAQTVLNYIDEFPMQRNNLNSEEMVMHMRLAESLKAAQRPDEEMYLRRVVRRSRSYVVLETRAKRASLAAAPPRTYTVIGSGGSSAVIEMPALKVEGVNTTVAVPSN